MQDEIDTQLIDFYSDYDPLKVDAIDQQEYERYLKSLSDEERALLQSGKHFYELTFVNKGGLVMPIIFQFQFEDGTSQDYHIPAEIWRKNSEEVSKVFATDKKVSQIVLDPYLETADTDRSNNYYPAQPQMNRF
ncbi:MAG: hypothetical protein R2795_13075 [Saprospiraceae bacterium]